jgi:UDP-N-acetylglucosamine 3-dehydrogenase
MTSCSMPVRSAVIGLGAMGQRHARIYGELPNVELVGVADVDQCAVTRATRGRLTRGYTRYEELLEQERPEIVSVAVPTRLHFEVTQQLIERGIHVLVEKPIASTIDQAQRMIQAAEHAGVRLMVGHIERFNPAIIELKRRLDQAGVIFKVSALRAGPFPERIRDVGVVIDLATHDIDVMRFLLERPIERLYAETARRIHTAHEDLLVGTIAFAGGVIGSLDVNWLTPTKTRELSVVGSCGTFRANYLTQELTFYENGTMPVAWEDLATLRGASEGDVTRYAIERKEPLRAELEAFVATACESGPSPMPPEDAMETLGIAIGLIESACTGQSVWCADSTCAGYVPGPTGQ